jgi:hypothetical protein
VPPSTVEGPAGWYLAFRNCLAGLFLESARACGEALRFGPARDRRSCGLLRSPWRAQAGRSVGPALGPARGRIGQ